MTTTIKLDTPIQAHGEPLTELTLRRPTTRECRQIGQLPYRIEKDESVGLNLDVAAKYIVVCAGIPSSSVDQLEVMDLNTVAWALAGFFMASPKKKEAKEEASAA
ncbi:ArsR family transcriptional regulator [Pseudomonas sp. 250J]|uniref:phage tail assembly protein n=1 Tax=unclassified Pseudomonas TaxID=196821 RepID=UPI000680D9B3|nr:phage tail assembly protein [Pseudomonas sp. 250J]KNX77180.1 ArsR family transcriptional regulator [Pseudomonas sp. 250J]